MKKRLKPIPEFASESDERAFWEAPGNDSTEYLDWSKAKLIFFPNLKQSKRKTPHPSPEAKNEE